MNKILLFVLAALGCLSLAGCPAAESTTPAPTSAPPAVKQGAGKKPSSSMSTAVEVAPPGVKTDLSGGLNGPKPKR